MYRTLGDRLSHSLTCSLLPLGGSWTRRECQGAFHDYVALHVWKSGDIRTTGFQGMIVYSEPISKEFSTLEITPAALQRRYKT